MRYLDQIKQYYDSSQWLYRLFVYNNTSLGMHYGFWEKGTKNRHDAIVNENKAIVDIGKIKKGQKVLDAGCGVGGTAIYIANKTGARVWGITLPQNQVELAEKYAIRNRVRNLVEFSVQDYTKTNFPNNFFDMVYGIESICYSYPKEKFLKEARRILKPGGKLIIADGYLNKEIQNKLEKERLLEFNKAFAIKELVNADKYSELIHKSGFKNLITINKTNEVLSSTLHFYRLGKIFLLPIKLLSLIPNPHFKAFNKNYIATKLMHEFFLSGFGKYIIHYAEKPKV